MPPSRPQIIHLSATGLIPNSKFPLLIYRSAFPTTVSAETIEKHFASNGWIPQWRYSMYPQSHYHATTHEALGVFSGNARLRFGTSDNESSTKGGIEEDVGMGDVIVIPAGVAHCAVKEVDGFAMVGAYPKDARQWDMNYGGEDLGGDGVEKGLPLGDPFWGKDINGLLGIWK